MKNRIGSIIRSFGYMLAVGIIILATFIPAKSVYAAGVNWEVKIPTIKNTSGGAVTVGSSNVVVHLYQTVSGNTEDKGIKENPLTGDNTNGWKAVGSLGDLSVSGNYTVKVESVTVNGSAVTGPTLPGYDKDFTGATSQVTIDLPDAVAVDATIVKITTAVKKTPHTFTKKEYEEDKIDEWLNKNWTTAVKLAKVGGSETYDATITWSLDDSEYDEDSTKAQTLPVEGYLECTDLPAVTLADETEEGKLGGTVIVGGSSSDVIVESQCKKDGKDNYTDADSVGIKVSGIDAKKIKTILNYQLKKYPNSTVSQLIEEYNDPTQYWFGVRLVVDKLSDSEADHEDKLKEKAQSYDGASSASIYQIFDMSLYLMVYDRTAGKWMSDMVGDDDCKITDAGTDIHIKYTVPSGNKLTSGTSSTKTKTRHYYVVRYHDKAHGVDNLDGYKDSTELEFTAKEFSEFAAVYYDTETGAGTSSSSSLSNSTAGGGGDAGSGGGAPKTADTAEIIRWTYFFIIGITVFLCALILLQDAKGYEDKDTE